MEVKPQEEEKKPRPRVKKAKGHGGHHGGAWKVAYADFVTAMMALFLVLWLVSQADTKLKQAIASYFRSPGVFDSMQGGILAQAKKVSKEPGNLTSKDDEQILFSVAQNLQKQFSTRPEFNKSKDQIQIDITEEGLRIQIIDKADRISFPSGSAKLTAEAEEILKEIALGICNLPNKINIGGHTDSHVFPSANGYTNWELSADRGNAARRVLEAGCVKPSQIRRIVGFADTVPMVPDDPFAPANRRISITVLRLTEDSSNSEKTSDSEEKTSEKQQSTVKPSSSPKKETKQNSNSQTENNTSPNNTNSNQSLSEEDKKLRNKLLNEGAVTVGEADKVPVKPKNN